MKKLFLIFFSVLSFLAISQDISSAMTFNIRYATINDGVNQWENRKKELTDLLNYYNPEIIGLQEALLIQINFILDHLPSYKKVGIAREDGKIEGEFSPILYDSIKYTIEQTGTFWLSENPNKPTIGWDAAHKRICTYAGLINKKTGELIWVFNTHFDHIGQEARIKSANLIIKKISEITLSSESIILMGDFNSLPNSAPISYIKSNLLDGLEISKSDFYGPYGTFNGFNPLHPLSENRIDYIFIKNLEITSYRHIDDKMKNSSCISDHLPILMTFTK